MLLNGIKGHMVRAKDFVRQNPIKILSIFVAISGLAVLLVIGLRISSPDGYSPAQDFLLLGGIFVSLSIASFYFFILLMIFKKKNLFILITAINAAFAPYILLGLFTGSGFIVAFAAGCNLIAGILAFPNIEKDLDEIVRNPWFYIAPFFSMVLAIYLIFNWLPKFARHTGT